MFLCYPLCTNGRVIGRCVEVLPTTAGEGTAAVTTSRLCCRWALVDCADRIHRWRRYQGLIFIAQHYMMQLKVDHDKKMISQKWFCISLQHFSISFWTLVCTDDTDTKYVIFTSWPTAIQTLQFLWPPCVADAVIIFLSCFYLSIFYFPRLISAVADWMSTILWHMM